uniref:Reverse transcriptase n=1 Tax=Ditylenchus dipsaci TaxID=166011 RepID=A0A915E6H9_9BILA
MLVKWPMLANRMSNKNSAVFKRLQNYGSDTFEDIFAKLSGGITFSQIDFFDAYLQVELNAETRKLCAINTLMGIDFCFQSSTFRAKPTPAIF